MKIFASIAPPSQSPKTLGAIEARAKKIENMFYNSNRNFRIWGYSVSHSMLLLRSERSYPDQDNYSKIGNYNIDLEFWNVSYIDLPDKITELQISIVEDAPLKVTKRDKFDRIFEIKSNENRFYIIASGCLIGKNQWISEDRLFNFSLNLEHEEVLMIMK